MSEYDMHPLPSSSQATANRQPPADPAPQAAVLNPMPQPMPALHPGLQPVPPAAMTPPAANQGAQVNRLPVLATGAKRVAPDTGFDEPGADAGKRARIGETAAEVNSSPAVDMRFAWSGGDVNARDGKGNTALMRAAGAGDLGLLRELLAVPGIDVNAKEDEGWTALHLAAQNGHAAVVQKLVAVPGIEVNAEINELWTALHLAARNGHAPVVQALLAAPDIEVNAVGCGDETVLHVAARKGHGAIVQMLLAAPDIEVNAGNGDGETALLVAAREGHAAIVQLLLAVPDIEVNAANDDAETALHLAAKMRNVEVMHALLGAHGIDVNRLDKWGATPLTIAAARGFEEMVYALLAMPGIMPNCGEGEGDTALSAAARYGRFRIVNAMLAMPGIDINASGERGERALDCAKRYGHRLIEIRLKWHREPTAAESSAILALLQKLCVRNAPARRQAARMTSSTVAASTSESHNAAKAKGMHDIGDSLQSGNYPAAELPALLRSISHLPKQTRVLTVQSLALGFCSGHYRNTNALQDGLKDTGLHDSYDEAINTLGKMSDINLCRVDGMNLLGIAAQQGNERMIRALLRLGALVNLPSPNGATALAIAVKQRQWGACAELISHGALPMLPDASGFPVLYHIVADFCSDAHCSEALALLIRYIRLKGISFDIPVRNPDEAARAEHPTVLLSDLLAGNPQSLVRYGHLLVGAPGQPQAAPLPH